MNTGPSATSESTSAAIAGVIPAPRNREARTGVFVLTADTAIVVCDDVLLDAASTLGELLAAATGHTFAVRAAGLPEAGAINFRLLTDAGESEAYDLEVAGDRVLISAADAAGAFYATQTLRQLLPVEVESDSATENAVWSIDAVHISDSPEYDYRGMHLDVSRHFFPVSFVKRYLDWMAMHKLNTFHWHLTDDQGWRLEIRRYPRLTEVGAWRKETVIGHTLSRGAKNDATRHGGFYTQDDVREVVRYAAERHITVIPEIDLPGHASALLAAYPEYACRDGDFEVAGHFGIFRDILCPAPETFEMLSEVLEEVAELFPGPYIHIGGDEVIPEQWRDSPRCQAIMRAEGFSKVGELQRYFIAELNRIVTRLGKTAIGWDDILDEGQECAMTVVAWHGPERARDAARQGNDVILSPGAFYFDSFQSESVDEPLAIHGLSTLRNVYEFPLVPEALEEEHHARILGAQGALWTEYIATEAAAEYMALPRLCALAEQVWSHESQRSWPGFVRRMRRHFERFDGMGLNASRSVYKPRATTELLADRSLEVVLETDGDDHSIHYTLDGSAPSPESPCYREPLVLAEPATIRASARDNRSGKFYGDTRLSFVPHLALGCPVVFAHDAEAGWNPAPEQTVVNGLSRSEGFFLHRDWAGFAGVDLDAVIDLGDIVGISEVAVGFDAGIHRRLYPPSGLAVSVSTDREHWQTAAEQEVSEDTARSVQVSFEKTQARYVRVVCRNDRRVFSYETKRPEAIALYVDEIIVR